MTFLSLSKINSQSAQALLSVAVMLAAGFLLTRITKKLRLPNVSGYIIAGVLIGPCVLNIVPQSICLKMDFLTDTAIAFISFSVGKYFSSKLRKCGPKVIVITVFEALLSGRGHSAHVFAFKYDCVFAFARGYASATARPRR